MPQIEPLENGVTPAAPPADKAADEQAKKAAHDAAKIAELKTAEAALCKLEAVVDRCKKALKTAKDNFNAAVVKLRDAVAQADQMSLFDPATGRAAGDDWKDVPLAEALDGVSAAVIQKLADADLATMGDLQAYLEKCRLTDIAGIGELKAEVIENRLEAFWAQRKAAGHDDGAGGIDPAVEAEEKKREAAESA